MTIDTTSAYKSLRSESRGGGLYPSAIIVDATAPIAPFSVIDTPREPEDYVRAYLGAGVTLAVFTIVDDFPTSIEQTIRLIGANRHYFLENQQSYSIIANDVDVRSAKAAGKMAVAFAFQGTNALMGDLSLVEVYRRLGVIQMLLAYNMGNFAADGCHEPRNAGLTAFGRSLVAEMNRVGVILDVTHVGQRSSLEALELTTRPAIFSHSTPRKFADHDRNITDEQIRACARTGGIICLTGVGIFVDGATHRATTSKIVDTINYVVELVGPHHAGIGLDYVVDPESMGRFLKANPDLYGGGDQYPEDGRVEFAAPAILEDICAELLRRGYSEADVRAILGENYLRVLAAHT